MSKQGIISYQGYEGYISRVVESKDFIDIRTERAGFFTGMINAGNQVHKGDLMAVVTDPYTGEERQRITACVDGVAAFVHSDTLAYQNTAAIKLIADKEIL